MALEVENVPVTIEERLAEEKNWKFVEEDGQKYVFVRGQKLRYYQYPPEKYNIEVRQMILNNTAAELEMLLDTRDNVGPNLSINELRHIGKALGDKLDSIPTYKGYSPEYKHQYQAICRSLCVVNFKLGIELIKDALAQAKQGKPMDEVLPVIKEAFSECVDQAPHYGMLGDIAVVGKREQGNYKTLQRLAQNLKMIADYKTPVETLITEWYYKIASVMIQMDKHFNTSDKCHLFGSEEEEYRSRERFFHTCCDLLQARRNEPEYAVALVDANAQLSAIREIRNRQHNVKYLQAATALVEQYEHIYRAAVAREPVVDATMARWV